MKNSELIVGSALAGFALGVFFDLLVAGCAAIWRGMRHAWKRVRERVPGQETSADQKV